MMDVFAHRMFNVDRNTLEKRYSALDAPNDRFMDYIFITVLMSFLQDEYNFNMDEYICYESDFVGEIHRCASKRFPVMIQTMNAFDVVFQGQLIHTRGIVNAFLYWCRIVHFRYDGKPNDAINLIELTDSLFAPGDQTPRSEPMTETPALENSRNIKWL
jgi:hypothetical protein